MQTPRPDDTGVRVLFVSAPSPEVARTLARALVERELAACVQVVPGIESHYRWKGELECAPEALLVIKTLAARVPAIERFLAAEHPYELAECVAIAAAEVEARYLAWLVAASGGAPAPSAPVQRATDP